jgi:hypothetical protein
MASNKQKTIWSHCLMKKFLFLIAALALGVAACQKRSSEAKQNAKNERRVPRRLDPEQRAQERQKMAQRQADLERRIDALAAKLKHSPAPTNSGASESLSTPPAGAVPDRAGDSYSVFYRKLEPYGDWMETSDYGYVFQPRQAAEGRDWRPYTDGHWIYTDAGWTWLSDEKFGWATYHYGRWIRLRGVGWVWVPGEQWAPAWVSWRQGGDYVGWAPLPPEAQLDPETGIRNWADNYYNIGPEQYAFVPANEFGSKLSLREILPTARNLTIINQTTNVTNIVYSDSTVVDRGPSYEDLRGGSRHPIQRLRLERTNESNIEGPVFRGEVVSLPTVEFRRAERATRPDRVVRKIAQPVVERGWAGIENTQAAQEVRAKMEAEVTPPTNLPPKRFVRPNQKNGNLSRPVPTTPGQIVSPAVSAATAIPIGTPAPLPSNPPTAPPTASPRPSPTAPAKNVSSPKLTGRESAGPAMEETRKRRQAERQQQKQQRTAQKFGSAPASPSATTSSASPTPDASGRKEAAVQRRTTRTERNATKKQAEPETTPEPAVSPP